MAVLFSFPSSPNTAGHVAQAWPSRGSPFPSTVISSEVGTQAGQDWISSWRPETWTLEDRDPFVLWDLELYLINTGSGLAVATLATLKMIV